MTSFLSSYFFVADTSMIIGFILKQVSFITDFRIVVFSLIIISTTFSLVGTSTKPSYTLEILMSINLCVAFIFLSKSICVDQIQEYTFLTIFWILTTKKGFDVWISNFKNNKTLSILSTNISWKDSPNSILLYLKITLNPHF